jgi:hypothetical protein
MPETAVQAMQAFPNLARFDEIFDADGDRSAAQDGLDTCQSRRWCRLASKASNHSGRHSMVERPVSGDVNS